MPRITMNKNALEMSSLPFLVIFIHQTVDVSLEVLLMKGKQLTR